MKMKQYHLNHVEHLQIFYMKMNLHRHHQLKQISNRMLLISLSNDLFFFLSSVSLIYVFVSSHSEQQLVLYKYLFVFVFFIFVKLATILFLCLFLTRSFFCFFIITHRPFSFNIYILIYLHRVSLFL
jgi:hypothetical protein